MAQKRENWVDAAKGIAIIFVVLGHVVASYQNVGLLTDGAVFSYIHTFAYSFHMPLFFVLSGYVAAKHPGRGSKLRRIGYKTLSLGIPYVVFSIMVWGIKFFMSSLVNTPASLGDLLRIPLYPILHLWFLYALLCMGVVHILLEKPLRTKTGSLLAVAAALTIRYLLLRCGLLEKWGLSGSVVDHVAGCSVWYFAGVACAGFLKDHAPGKAWWPVAAVGLGIYGVLVWWNARSGQYHDATALLLSAAGTALFMLLAMCLSKSTLLTFLGRNSLPVYLLHEMVLTVARMLLTRLGVPLLGGVMPILLAGSLGIVAPLLGYWVCSKIKPLDFCFYPGKYVKKRKP